MVFSVASLRSVSVCTVRFRSYCHDSRLLYFSVHGVFQVSSRYQSLSYLLSRELAQIKAGSSEFPIAIWTKAKKQKFDWHSILNSLIFQAKRHFHLKFSLHFGYSIEIHIWPIFWAKKRKEMRKWVGIKFHCDERASEALRELICGLQVSILHLNLVLPSILGAL